MSPPVSTMKTFDKRYEEVDHESDLKPEKNMFETKQSALLVECSLD